MHHKILAQLLLALGSLFAAANPQNPSSATASPLAMNAVEGWEVHSAKLDAVEVPNLTAQIATYGGPTAVKIENKAGVTAAGTPANGETRALLKGSEFGDGTIEAEVTGWPRPGAGSRVRGFAGIALRVGPQGSKYESISLRQTNGRAGDQLGRDHSTQYAWYPNFPWRWLRDENPGVYESYVDLDPRVWTDMKIVVAGTQARLYVNGAAQPCLIVSDLKLGDTRGQIAPWAGTDTEGVFLKSDCEMNTGELPLFLIRTSVPFVSGVLLKKMSRCGFNTIDERP
jgi:hypothetical protein